MWEFERFGTVRIKHKQTKKNTHKIIFALLYGSKNMYRTCIPLRNARSASPTTAFQAIGSSINWARDERKGVILLLCRCRYWWFVVEYSFMKAFAIGATNRMKTSKSLGRHTTYFDWFILQFGWRILWLNKDVYLLLRFLFNIYLFGTVSSNIKHEKLWIIR